VSGSCAKVRVRHNPIARRNVGRCGLNWLDPQAIRPGVKPDMEGRAWLTGAWSEPPAKQVRKLIARHAGRPGNIAVLLRKPELPYRSINETDVRLSFWNGDTAARWELQYGIPLV
jgi:hypothetical protein